jgi:hypothetical protein
MIHDSAGLREKIFLFSSRQIEAHLFGSIIHSSRPPLNTAHITPIHIPWGFPWRIHSPPAHRHSKNRRPAWPRVRVKPPEDIVGAPLRLEVAVVEREVGEKRGKWKELGSPEEMQPRADRDHPIYPGPRRGVATDQIVRTMRPYCYSSTSPEIFQWHGDPLSSQACTAY